MDKVIKNKRGLVLVTSLSSGHEKSSEKFLSLFVIYYLTNLMMKCKAVFELFQKLHLQIYASQFMTSYYSTSICPFESRKCGKEPKKS